MPAQRPPLDVLINAVLLQPRADVGLLAKCLGWHLALDQHRLAVGQLLFIAHLGAGCAGYCRSLPLTLPPGRGTEPRPCFSSQRSSGLSLLMIGAKGRPCGQAKHPAAFTARTWPGTPTWPSTRVVAGDLLREVHEHGETASSPGRPVPSGSSHAAEPAAGLGPGSCVSQQSNA